MAARRVVNRIKPNRPNMPRVRFRKPESSLAARPDKKTACWKNTATVPASRPTRAARRNCLRLCECRKRTLFSGFLARRKPVACKEAPESLVNRFSRMMRLSPRIFRPRGCRMTDSVEIEERSVQVVGLRGSGYLFQGCPQLAQLYRGHAG